MSKFVQIIHPLTMRYIKLSRITGRIVAHKRSLGPYAGVPIWVGR